MHSDLLFTTSTIAEVEGRMVLIMEAMGRCAEAVGKGAIGVAWAFKGERYTPTRV